MSLFYFSAFEKKSSLIPLKTAESLENTGKVDIVVLDKTGTITRGQPAVTDVVPFVEDSGEKIVEKPMGEKNIGGQKMTKVLKIEGMMCQHCEKHVKDALEKIDGVESALTSHEKANAIVELSKEVSEEAFSKAVVDAGYEFKGIE